MMFVKTEDKVVVETYGTCMDNHYPGQIVENAQAGVDYLRVTQTRSNKPIIAQVDVDTFRKMARMVQFPQVHAIPEEGFLYRTHRGTLVASLLTTRHMKSFADLKRHLRHMDFFFMGIDNLEVKKYGEGIDKRIGWDTYVVTINGNAVGFTSGPVE